MWRGRGASQYCYTFRYTEYFGSSISLIKLCVCVFSVCTLSSSASIADLHSFCRTGRAVECLDGAFGTALAANWRQYSSCTIEFKEKICPYCTIKYMCFICTIWMGLAASWLCRSSVLHHTKTSICCCFCCLFAPNCLTSPFCLFIFVFLNQLAPQKSNVWLTLHSHWLGIAGYTIF